MKQVLQRDGRPIHAWVGTKHENNIWQPDIEDSALEQLYNVATLPFVDKHGIAVMPDVHFGIGATVGSVIATSGAIIPAAVGVDIGCGMNAVRTSLSAKDLPDSLSNLRHSIERGVPLGVGGTKKEPIKHALFDLIPEGFDVYKASCQLGTLGSGNHFIEVCLDEEQRVWIMLHSGSRSTGNQIGTKFISEAKKLAEKFFISLPDQNLAYFPDGTPEFEAYWSAVKWAQEYASLNRKVMMKEVLKNLTHTVTKSFTCNDEAINCHHNYVERENHFGRNLIVTRKGAIRAREGDLGIIPGSMGTRSYIVRGLGNVDSYHSCSHGAGRRMGRKEATRRFTVADLELQTSGVECRKDAMVLDEIPGAYKDIDVVMENQKDLVEIVHTLKQVLCVKGN